MKIRIVVLSLAMAAMVVAEPPSGYSYKTDGYNYNNNGGVDTYEGATLDPTLLEKVRVILLREEQNSASSGGEGISSTYGAPYPVYGVPGIRYKIVGIDLGAIKRALLVAKYDQISYQPGGYPVYGAPKTPPSTYGAPY